MISFTTDNIIPEDGDIEIGLSSDFIWGEDCLIEEET